MANAAQEPNEGEQIGCHGAGAELDHLVPKWVHHIVAEWAGVDAAVAVVVEAAERLLVQVLVVEHGGGALPTVSDARVASTATD